MPAHSGRAWNSWWSRRSPNLLTNENPPARIGIDVGSKTIKLVALDEPGETVYALYHRHRGDVLSTFAELLHETIWRYGDVTVPVAITGSAGIALAEALGLPFVQEVVATTNAVRRAIPHANCIIELGGEDAKIIYLDAPIEQRMNATCAGGTGDFIDSISSMLGIKTREISRTALGHTRTYPIASRCAVFAQTDVRPLINAGARKSDIAQSALEAVVDQTLGGLACGRPIRGNVVFLGGPLEHIPALVMAFRSKLALTNKTGIKPTDAHLFTAKGAILTAGDAPSVALSELESRAQNTTGIADDANHLTALFKNKTELEEFRLRHMSEHVERKSLGDAEGPLYLGFDAGSTTVKYVLIDERGTIVASDYRESEGDTFELARDMLVDLLSCVNGKPYKHAQRTIAYSAVCGYGEGLLRAGLGFDMGVVETAAHLRSALHFRPDASFVLDIGGQDMKALWIQDGHVVDSVLNEACSSGCGAFIHSTAKSLQVTDDELARLAISAHAPIDLGAKCTVFMTSRVRHAQKTGASREDIAAGIAYSVINNAMTRIIGNGHGAGLGSSVVVQGGAFKSDAVLRAFELACGVDAIRPDASHLMGAYGAALIARDNAEGQSRLLSAETCSSLKPVHSSMRCPGCSNECLLSVIDFGYGKSYLSGNRCERAKQAVFGNAYEGKRNEGTNAAPNTVALEQRLIASFGNTEGKGSRAHVCVGLINTLSLYESTPFWHTLLSELGFGITMPNDMGSEALKGKAAETVPSESVCYPAKLTHLRFAYLRECGADFVFMPHFEQDGSCPVCARYAHVIATNVDDAELVSPLLRSSEPEAICASDKDVEALLETLNGQLDERQAITQEEFACVLECARQAQRSFEKTLTDAGKDAFAWAAHDSGRRIAILTGRPYHADPSLLHRIDEELVRIGFAVVGNLGIADILEEKTGSSPLWRHGAYLLSMVEALAANPQTEIVALRSFGCGYDAVSMQQAHDRARQLQRPFTELKIDDIVDTAHIRIRLRTLAHTCGLGSTPKPRHAIDPDERTGQTVGMRRDSQKALATPDLCSTAKALAEYVAAEYDRDTERPDIAVPTICRECLQDALPFELVHMRPGAKCDVRAEGTLRPHRIGNANTARTTGGRIKVGLLGNPLLVFDENENEHIVELLDLLGCEVVLPQPELVAVEDVRYFEQLDIFAGLGVNRVIYLQSFGCLKGHIHARGSLRELERRYPDMPITVIDYDPESSALNRENRIRLAVSMK